MMLLFRERTQFAALIFVLLLAGCGGSDHPPGTKIFEANGLSLHYPDTWMLGETTSNSTFLSNQPLELQDALLEKGLSTGQAAIFVLWSDHAAWMDGLSAADIHSRLLGSYEGDGARFGYRVDTTQAHDETLGGKTVSIAPMIRQYQPDADVSSMIQNEGLLLAVDLGSSFSVRITCLADHDEFTGFEAICRQVAESMHYEQ